MERLFVFIIRNDIWIYILCGLGLVWYTSELARARRLLRRAMFGLEREKGRRIQRNAVAFIVFFAALISLVTYVNINVAPTIPRELLKPPTPTPNIFQTPLSSPTAYGSPEKTPTIGVAPTVTLRPLDSPVVSESTVIPNADIPSTGEPGITPSPPVSLGPCTPEINISAPPNNSTSSGQLTFFGSANANEFSAYSIEALGLQTGQTWQMILGGAIQEPTFDSILATVDLSNWLEGNYYFRLVVVDQSSTEIGQCIVQVTLATGNS